MSGRLSREGKTLALVHESTTKLKDITEQEQSTEVSDRRPCQATEYAAAGLTSKSYRNERAGNNKDFDEFFTQG